MKTYNDPGSGSGDGRKLAHDQGKTDVRQLDPDVEDALYELGNVGMGQATSALGNMIGGRITITTPKVNPVQTDLTKLVANYEDKVSLGILMSLDQKLHGMMLIIIDRQFMTNLVLKLTGEGCPEEKLLEDDFCRSVIQEVANIMASSYMSALGAYTGLRVYLSPVVAGVDAVDKLVEYPVQKMSLDPKNCFCVDTSFTVRYEQDPESVYQGSIVLFPDDESIDVLTSAMLS